MAHEAAAGSSLTAASTPVSASLSTDELHFPRAGPEDHDDIPDPPDSLFLPEQLPSANIARIMKQTLPVTSKISREAKDAMSLCVSEFISFLTSEANDRTIAEKRKTVTGDDVLHALRVLGFENYETVCTIWLAKYRAAQNARPRGPKSGQQQAETPSLA